MREHQTTPSAAGTEASNLSHLLVPLDDNLPSTHAELYFDGCSKRNPGEASVGVWGTICGESFEIGKRIGVATNNEAEWMAALLALLIASNKGAATLRLYGDSQLVINQLRREWKVKSETLIAFMEDAADLEERFQDVQYCWVPRELNTQADRVANRTFLNTHTNNNDNP
ncbi:MAG: ribonuclease HI family protein [Planctomycetes bacterium]|nr:ribonuclease HI family protein [Planctomycetota bacterium]